MSQYIGDVSAYAYAVSKGYTGTEEEFAELMADYADVGQRAEDAAESALNSKTAAQTAAQTATTKAGEASTSATSAEGSATAASASAFAASGSATQAAASATSAGGSATAAAGSATTASTKASEASASATDAATAKTGAEAAQTAAETAQGKAEDAQEAAETTAQSISASAAQIATNAVDIAELKSEVSQKANVDGAYSDLTAGNAEQLVSTVYEEDSVPYIFRTAGGSMDIGDREEDMLVGGTVAWNQIAKELIESNYNKGNGTAVYDNGTASFTAASQYGALYGLTLNPLVNGHKYLINSDIKLTEATGVNKIRVALGNTGYNQGAVYVPSESPVNTFVNASGVVQYNPCTNPTYNYLFIQDNRAETSQIDIKNLMLIDLTQMFGSTIADYIYSLEQANAGAGVAWFRRLFPADYYPYDAGTLKSVEGVSSHDMVGFNQWDEEWEVGYYNDDGTPVTNANRIRSKNRIRVLPNTTYYVDASVNNYELYVLQYTEDGTFISKQLRRNNTFTTDDNAFGILFFVVGISSYNHDICINLSDPAKNGTYEPYVKHTYPLDNTLTLRGIPKLADGKLSYDGDRYLPDGTVKRRYGIVDLGTLTWIKSNLGYFAGTLTGAYINNSAITALCSKYEMIKGSGFNSALSGTKPYACVSSYHDNSHLVCVFDPAYSSNTANEFKTAMNGVYLVYELATPTTESADPYQSLQVCDPNGTEEFVTTGIVPVGHETRYPENLRAKIEGLPWDFSSLIAPTEKTTTASRNYTTGSLLIMNNVLYKVTANIANGGTITPNTNVTATTLSEVISALQ